MISIPNYDKKIEFGTMTYFNYEIDGTSRYMIDYKRCLDEKILIATTRIETMLGDVAIVIHPKDERHKVKIKHFKNKINSIYIINM